MTATSLSQMSAGLPSLCQWQRATWQDYVALRDAPTPERMKLTFNSLSDCQVVGAG